MSLILYALLFCGQGDGQCLIWDSPQYQFVQVCDGTGDKVRGTRSHAFADAHTSFTMPSGKRYTIVYLPCPSDPV